MNLATGGYANVEFRAVSISVSPLLVELVDAEKEMVSALRRFAASSKDSRVRV